MITKTLLKNRNFYFLTTYQFLVGLADKLFQFSIPWLVYDLTQSATQMVLTFGVTMAPYMIFCFFGGTFVDYFNRRTMLLVTTTLSALTLIGFAIAINHAPHKIELEAIYVLCFLVATYNAIEMPVIDASVVDYFEKEEFLSVNSTLEVATTSCYIIGPLLAGILVKQLGAKDTMLSIGFLFVAALALIKFSKPERESSACKKYEGTGEFIYEHSVFVKEGFDYLFKADNPILFVIMMSFMNNIIFGSKDVLMIYLVNDTLQMNAESFGTIVAIGSAFSLIIIGLIVYKLRKLNTFTLMVTTLFIDAIVCAIIGISDQKVFILGFYCMTILTESLYNIFSRTFRQNHVPSKFIGRTIGISRSLTHSGLALSSIISGFLLEFISVKAFFAIGGILLSLTTIILYRLQKRFNPSIVKAHAE